MVFLTSYTYLTLGSWEHDIGAMINGLSRGKQKRKEIPSLSFFQPIFLSFRQQAMGGDSRLRKRLQSKGISQTPFLTNNHADDQYQKNWSSLKDSSLSCIRYVRQYCFTKNRIVLPRARRLFPGNASHAAAASTVCTTLAYCCVLVDFQ